MKRERGGALKGILIGCVVLIVLGIIAGGVGYWYLKKNASRIVSGVVQKGGEKALEAFEKRIKEILPAGYDVKKVEEAFEVTKKGLKDGSIKPEDFGKISSKIGEAIQDGKLTPEELDEIVDYLKQFSSEGRGPVY